MSLAEVLLPRTSNFCQQKACLGGEDFGARTRLPRAISYLSARTNNSIASTLGSTNETTIHLQHLNESLP